MVLLCRPAEKQMANLECNAVSAVQVGRLVGSAVSAVQVGWLVGSVE